MILTLMDIRQSEDKHTHWFSFDGERTNDIRGVTLRRERVKITVDGSPEEIDFDTLQLGKRFDMTLTPVERIDVFTV